jgi:hypothetical protein
VGDPLEHEADRLADRVTRHAVVGADSPRPTTQHIDGAMLSDADREYFQPCFGHDFSAVRIHTDQAAAESARSIGAKAYTVGSHIFFGANEYQPENQSGRRLLAHELAHTIQQTALSTPSGDGVAQRQTLPAPRVPGTAPSVTQATRITSGEGNFTVDTYRPVDSAPGQNVAKDVGAEIKLTFRPASVVFTDKIAFIQVLRPIVLFANERGRATQASAGEAGWALDRLAGRKSPIYGENDNGTAGANTHFGYQNLSGTEPAWMYDRTSEPRAAGAAVSLVGTSFALDAQHGAYLGGVRWGFNCSAAGAVTTVPVSLESAVGPTGPQRRALELWNAQAADPNPSRRNAPGQQPVPLP